MTRPLKMILLELILGEAFEGGSNNTFLLHSMTGKISILIEVEFYICITP